MAGGADDDVCGPNNNAPIATTRNLPAARDMICTPAQKAKRGRVVFRRDKIGARIFNKIFESNSLYGL